MTRHNGNGADPREEGGDDGENESSSDNSEDESGDDKDGEDEGDNDDNENVDNCGERDIEFSGVGVENSQAAGVKHGGGGKSNSCM